MKYLAVAKILLEILGSACMKPVMVSLQKIFDILKK